MKEKRVFVMPLLLSFLLPWVSVSDAGIIDPKLKSTLDAAGPREEIAVIVTLADRVDLRGMRGFVRAEIMTALKSKAVTTQNALLAHLQERGVWKLVSLWAINGIAFSGHPGIVRELAAFPEVESIRLDATLSVPIQTLGVPETPEWNLSAIHAPDLWSMSYTGSSVVVASMDTGVDVNHPDLQSKWRGGSNSWYDPNGEHDTPYDANGHGTQSMGIIVGGSAGGTAIGVAPDAQWIAVKIFNDSGSTTYSAIHQGFQWLLDPDNNASTDDSPDVVNNSWILDNINDCATEFQSDHQVLREFGISTAFSAGNYGPNPSTSASPANCTESFAVGATDSSNTIAYFSSRGPSGCDGSIYPEVVAPGLNIRTTDLTLGGVFPNSYITVSGTSFAAPHVAGAMALLLDAFPDLPLPVLEEALKHSAVDLADPGPDINSGYGLIDALAAYNNINSSAGNPPVAVDEIYMVEEDTTLSIASSGVLGNDNDPDEDPLTAALIDGPTHGTLSLNTDGAFTYIPILNFNGTDSFTYRANDGNLDSNIATATITVNPVNDPPVAVNESVTTPRGVALTISVTGNDYDIDGAIAPTTTVIVTSPKKGSVVNNGDGTVTYTPKKKFRRTESFSYIVNDDGSATSNVATVTITIEKPKL